MKILIYCAHPAQFYFFKNCIGLLKENGHRVLLLIKTKDILESLVKENGYEYINILEEGRTDSNFGMAWGLFKRNIRLLKIILKERPNIMLGSDPSIAQIGFLCRINAITVLEDDYNVIPKLAKLTYPFTNCILTPMICDVGKWDLKKVGYNGYMKLAYLHPKYFKPNKLVVEKVTKNKFSLLRLSKLTAHHDEGVSGISDIQLKNIIDLLLKKGDVYISAERHLDEKYEKYRLKIKPSELHHFLYYAQILVSDSQSMSVEAAILGTPSVRISDFAGKISVLEELEQSYKLTFGINPNETNDLLSKIEELINKEDYKYEIIKRREKLLEEKINVTTFLVWFIENFPDSFTIMKENPNYQYRFKK